MIAGKGIGGKLRMARSKKYGWPVKKTFRGCLQGKGVNVGKSIQ